VGLPAADIDRGRAEAANQVEHQKKVASVIGVADQSLERLTDEHRKGDDPIILPRRGSRHGEQSEHQRDGDQWRTATVDGTDCW
jgi:hypothetical protein